MTTATDDDFFSKLPTAQAASVRVGAAGKQVHLPGWTAGFAALPGGGWLPLHLVPKEEKGLTPTQRDALIALLAGQQTLAETMLAAVAAALPVLREHYGDYLTVGPGPGLASALQPRSVTLHDLGSSSAVIGVELDCEWDPEHGLGVLLRDAAVLGLGSADVAFTAWMVRAAVEGRDDTLLWRPKDYPGNLACRLATCLRE